MPATKVASVIIPRGTPSLPFTQLVANASTTRVGTTATLTMASTATLTTGDNCLIQGHGHEEYNGIFQVTVTSATTITYVIKQDPGANSAVTNATVDKVVLGTALNMTTDYGAQVVIGLQNGAIGPTVAPQVWVGLSHTINPVDYLWQPLFAGDSVAKSLANFVDTVEMATMFVNYMVCRNTGQTVDVYAVATEVVSG